PHAPGGKATGEHEVWGLVPVEVRDNHVCDEGSGTIAAVFGPEGAVTVAQQDADAAADTLGDVGEAVVVEVADGQRAGLGAGIQCASALERAVSIAEQQAQAAVSLSLIDDEEVLLLVPVEIGNRDWTGDRPYSVACWLLEGAVAVAQEHMDLSRCGAA